MYAEGALILATSSLPKWATAAQDRDIPVNALHQNLARISNRRVVFRLSPTFCLLQLSGVVAGCSVFSFVVRSAFPVALPCCLRRIGWIWQDCYELLARAVKAHLARPAIPAVTELLRGLCAAAGLCLERVECILRARVAALREQSLAVQEAVERSQRFWRAMLAGLPTGCHLPLSPMFRWRHRAHCAHQSPERLREPLWQPKAKNAAVAAPRRSAHSSLCPATSADLSSTSSRKRASREAR